MRTSARFVSLLLCSLSSGVLFGTRASLGPSTRSFTPTTYVEVQQATVRNLRPVMGVLLPAAVAANAVELAFSARSRHPATVALTGSALAAQLTSLVLTGVVELPINARVMTWSSKPPQGWTVLRDRWATVHTTRTASSVTGLVLLIAAALSSEAAGTGGR